MDKDTKEAIAQLDRQTLILAKSVRLLQQLAQQQNEVIKVLEHQLKSPARADAPL